MEFLNKKVPLLSSGWTIIRGVKYAGKLCVFVLVPGLHQIARKRSLLGGILFSIFIAANFVVSNRPVEIYPTWHIPEITLAMIKAVAMGFSWALLIFDAKQLEATCLKPVYFVLVFFVLSSHSLPLHDHGMSLVFVEREGQSCPAFCKNDVIRYEYVNRWKQRISVGDYVVVNSNRNFVDPYKDEHLYVSKIISVASGEACAVSNEAALLQAQNHNVCLEDYNLKPDEYAVLGGTNPGFKTDDGRDISIVESYRIFGTNPKKIGNINVNNLENSRITRFIGMSLVTLYKWTGIIILNRRGE
ncbi:MAG: hypothetical protein HOE62_08560 [Alphaproteobacteria bacterium]|jgi:hypothetical protein|nr:hypothetical protein [Alphaproteobacteria bacterium]